MSLFNTGIRPAIDEHLLELSKEVRSYGDYWSASSAGYCMRRVIFERLGVPHVEKDSDGRKQRVFTAGHIFHDWVQGITKEAGLSIAQELELQDEDLMIRGHIDDLVLVPNIITEEVVRENLKDYKVSDIKITPKDRLILYDYKTQNSRAFTYQKGRPISYYHKYQLGTYMYMLRNGHYKMFDNADSKNIYFDLNDGTLKPAPISSLTEARILKISKDDLRMDENQLLWSDKLEGDIVTYWTVLGSAWDYFKESGKLPGCTCADHENGFLAREAYNPYYFEGEPCSLKLYEKFKAEKVKA